MAAAEAKLVDLRHLGRERVIGCWELGRALVDPGPESCVETLMAELGAEPQALLLTHIHLDHAGASGALVQRFPELEIWVHERGAPHLVDPSKLLQSAGRLYGDDMERLWGEVVPVPERNIRVLRGGETIEVAGRSIEVTYAPGHASHHVVYFDRGHRTAYVGDVAGVQIPPARFILPPTPPPDIEVEAWNRSLSLVAGMNPRRLALTHFGAVEDVTGHLAEMEDRLREQAALAKLGLAEPGGLDGAEPPVGFVAETIRRIEDACDERTARVYLQAAPPQQLWLGLKRYWEQHGAAPTLPGMR